MPAQNIRFRFFRIDGARAIGRPFAASSTDAAACTISPASGVLDASGEAVITATPVDNVSAACQVRCLVDGLLVVSAVTITPTGTTTGDGSITPAMTAEFIDLGETIDGGFF